MEKKLYEGQKHTMYELCKKLGVRPYTLYRLDSIDKVYTLSTKTFLGIAKAEEQEPFELIEKITEYFDKEGKTNAKEKV